MKWIKRFFNGGHEYEHVVTDIPLTAVARWYVYDTGLGNENDISIALGLTPVSDEGDIKEKQDSALRISKITSMLPFIDFISGIAADAIAEIQLNEIEKSGLHNRKELEEELESIRMVYQAVAMSGLIGAFSIASHLGMISINAVSSNLLDMEDDEDEY